MSLGIKIYPLYLGDYHHRGMPFSTSEYKGTTLGFEHFSVEAFEPTKIHPMFIQQILNPKFVSSYNAAAPSNDLVVPSP